MRLKDLLDVLDAAEDRPSVDRLGALPDPQVADHPNPEVRITLDPPGEVAGTLAGADDQDEAGGHAPVAEEAEHKPGSPSDDTIVATIWVPKSISRKSRLTSGRLEN
jgi:hypothetical protein